MRKVLLISGLALAVAGCATGQGESPSDVQVRDLSSSRERDAGAEYRVEAGDTLYGIAWRHDMDHRDLARLNEIPPPYRIQPGQRLILGADGERREGGRSDAEQNERRGVVATGLSGGQEDEELDWLSPDDEAIERNRGLRARPLEEAVGDPDAEGPSAEAMSGAAEVSGSDEGPGPVYDYDSPGADGSLSERDLAEREARETERAGADGEASPSREREDEDAAASRQEDDADSRAEQTADASRDRDDEPATQDSDSAEDAGTSVAGEPEAETRSGNGYTPVEEVPWQWPVEGEVVGRFGEGDSITAGIDIAGEKGQPVKAAGPGIVVYAGDGVRGYGNLVLLKHNDEFLSAYAHNDSLRVKENDVVEAGEVIATMGDSDAEDVRLHFEVRKEGQPQDPLDFLPSR
jgi:lipoprotein NlpD